MAKEKKAKPKKEKKQKVKKQKPEGGKKGGKKKLLLLIPLLAIIGAGVYFFVLKGEAPGFLSGLMGGGGASSKSVDVYAVGEEMVSSITAALEDCGDETLMSITTNVSAEGEEGAEAQEEEKDKKEEKEKQKLNRGVAQVIPEENGDGTLWTYYYYQIGEASLTDLAAYSEFLTGEGFTKTAGNGEGDFAAMGTYERVAETDADFIFSIELEYPLAGDMATGLFAVKATMEEKEELIVETVQTMSRDEALNYFSGLDHTKLGLELPVSEYNMTIDMGRAYIDGKDCYGINLYSKGSQSYFVKKFFLSLADKKIYEYIDNDIYDLESLTGNYFSISRNSAGPASDSAASAPAPEAAQPQQSQPQQSQPSAQANSANSIHDWNFGPLE